MKNKKLIGLLVIGFILIMFQDVFSQSQNEDWKKGHLTEIGKDFIKVDGKRYNVSPKVIITGKQGDDLGSELKKLIDADEVTFKMLNDIIIEIRVLRLTS